MNTEFELLNLKAIDAEDLVKKAGMFHADPLNKRPDKTKRYKHSLTEIFWKLFREKCEMLRGQGRLHIRFGEMFI